MSLILGKLETIIFQRNDNSFFLGEPLVGDNDFIYTGDDAHVVIDNSTAFGGTLIFTGKLAGLTVTDTLVMVGNDKGEELTQDFDEFIRFNASYGNGLTPSLNLTLVNAQNNEFIERLRTIVSASSNVSDRREFKVPPVKEPGKVQQKDLIVRTQFGASVLIDDFFTRNSKQYSVGDIEPITNLLGSVINHWEFTCHQNA